MNDIIIYVVNKFENSIRITANMLLHHAFNIIPCNALAFSEFNLRLLYISQSFFK